MFNSEESEVSCVSVFQGERGQAGPKGLQVKILHSSCTL